MNRIVVITGASSGLGLSLSKRFVGDRDYVFGISKTRRHWKNAFSQIGKSTYFSLKQLDVTRETQVEQYLRAILKKAGKIDIVINNAGYGGTLSNVEKLTATEFRKHMDQNLLSAFLTSKCALPILKRQKNGLIINVSSMAGKRAVPGLFGYSASKFGMLALSQCIAKENQNTGLKCITVCPGGMNSEMRAKLFGKDDAEKQQSTDFVADVIFQIVTGEIKVESGGDIVIRHRAITAINLPPPA